MAKARATAPDAKRQTSKKAQKAMSFLETMVACYEGKLGGLDQQAANS
jgi:hypothetical protein